MGNQLEAFAIPNYYDETFIPHNLQDTTLILLTITMSLHFYYLAFYIIGFIFIDKLKRHICDLKRANRDVVWSLMTNDTSAKEIQQRRESGAHHSTHLKKDSDKSIHLCRFCDQDKHLIYSRLFWESWSLFVRLCFQLCGFLAVILVQRHWWAFTFMLVYMISNFLTIYQELMECHFFMSSVKCGFARISQIFNLVILLFLIPSFVSLVIYFSYFVTTDHGFTERLKLFYNWIGFLD